MVNESYAYRNGTDPAFYDDDDMRVCLVCNKDYSFEEYASKDICFNCDEGGAG